MEVIDIGASLASRPWVLAFRMKERMVMKIQRAWRMYRSIILANVKYGEIRAVDIIKRFWLKRKNRLISTGQWQEVLEKLGYPVYGS